MGEFEQWFKSLNENGRVTYFLGQEGKIAKEAWDFQQSKIEQLEKEKQALHNAFVYMDECRKEWHQGFMRLHEQKNEALKVIENHARYIPQSTVEALKKALRGERE